MCVAGPEFLQLTGITEKDFIKPALHAKCANDQSLVLLGAVFATFRGHSPGGKAKETQPIVYLAEGV